MDKFNKKRKEQRAENGISSENASNNSIPGNTSAEANDSNLAYLDSGSSANRDTS